MWTEVGNLVSKDNNLPVCEFTDGPCDVESPRVWLESKPNGAYTVIRCDLLRYGDTQWKIWGEAFHLDRLCVSFRLLDGASDNLDYRLIRDKASTALQYLLETIKYKNYDCGYFAETFMVTLLVHRSASYSSISVQGHIVKLASRRTLTDMLELPPSIGAMIATDSCGGDTLPSRKLLPSAKLSSWCSGRRPLESIFKKPYAEKVGEVILVSEQCILEGLTSNIVVLYQDSTVRTPSEGMLFGYSRSLVLDFAQRCGFSVKEGVIPLSECNKWREVYFTSAVKLLVPVHRIWKTVNGSAIELLWSRDDNIKDSLDRVHREVIKSVLK